VELNYEKRNSGLNSSMTSIASEIARVVYFLVTRKKKVKLEELAQYQDMDNLLERNC
jgi:NADP-dependent 3-hydroxy acid dehydrogenase YdfG